MQAKLDQPIPMGCSNVGQVIEVGTGVERFRVGDRVVSDGPLADPGGLPTLGGRC